MKKSFICLLLALLCGHISAQNTHPYELLLSEEDLGNTVSFLADDANTGRASGTEGNSRAAQFIVQKFKGSGLNPYNWTYTQSFRYKDSIILRNVAAVLPSTVPSNEYVIITAHYDHLGELKGTIYNGADDNASGVASLIALADMSARIRRAGGVQRKNLIFVALDGKELSLAGSKYFIKHLNIPAKNITAAINMDILGSNLVPPGKDSSYILAIGDDSMPQRYRGSMKYICQRQECRLDVCMSFYGSRDFTKMVYENGDHWIFAKAGIPAMFFTSGFHQHTYKSTDDVEIVNLPLLKKRTLAIFNYINMLCR